MLPKTSRLTGESSCCWVMVETTPDGPNAAASSSQKPRIRWCGRSLLIVPAKLAPAT